MNTPEDVFCPSCRDGGHIRKGRDVCPFSHRPLSQCARESPEQIFQMIRVALRGPPAGSSPSSQKGEQLKNQQNLDYAGNLIGDSILRQAPRSVGEIYDFALKLLAKELDRANGSFESFHERIDQLSLFHPYPAKKVSGRSCRKKRTSRAR
jgi:hypothetical protein